MLAIQSALTEALIATDGFLFFSGMYQKPLSRFRIAGLSLNFITLPAPSRAGRAHSCSYIA